VPLTVTLVVFHELIYVARVLACQQRMPAPSKVNGAVIVDVTGLHVPTPDVAVTVGVRVRVLVGPGVGVRVGVLEIPTVGVLVRVAVRVTVALIAGVRVRVGVRDGVIVPVGEFVMAGVSVRVGVFVITGVNVRVGEIAGVRLRVGVRVGVFVAATTPPGSTPQISTPLEYRVTLFHAV